MRASAARGAKTPPPRRPRRTTAARKAAIRKTVRTAGPSAAAICAGAAIEAGHAALHLPPVPYGWMAAGGVITLRGRDAIDALRVRRSGGKAAARRRRKFQGHATMPEVREKLSVGAARRRAKVSRPSLAGPVASPHLRPAWSWPAADGRPSP